MFGDHDDECQYPDVTPCEPDVVKIFTRYVCVGTVPVKYGQLIARVVGLAR